MTAIDLESAKPAEIYAAIAAMDEAEFEALMDDPKARGRVIDVLIEEMAGRFRPEAAEGVEARIQIKLWDRPGGGYDHYEMRISDGACTLSGEPGGEPDLTLKVRPTDLRKIILGETGPRRLALKGRLRALGDLGLGRSLPDLFEL